MTHFALFGVLFIFRRDFMRKTWEHRRPIIKFKVSPGRKRKEQQQPIEPSRYFKYLSEIGAGWRD